MTHLRVNGSHQATPVTLEGANGSHWPMVAIPYSFKRCLLPCNVVLSTVYYSAVSMISLNKLVPGFSLKSLCLACMLLVVGTPLVHAELLPIPERGRYLKTAEALVDAYIEANGGKDHIKTISSVRMIGKVTEDNEQSKGAITYDVVLIKKRPSLRRMILRWQGRAIHIGYNGETAWRRIVGENAAETTIITGKDAEQFAADSQFDGPLVHWQERSIKLELLGLDMIGRSECYVLRTTETNGTVTDTYIDTRTFTELKVVNERSVDGKVEKIETLMSGYRKYDSIWLAMRIQRSVNGKISSDMVVESVDINFGVFNDYFDPPKTDGVK
ncbi:MAG: hypothetical protein SFY80_03970 [Verrucomicrobiota bacterium]|nr:hypothetical protein [Verrucomicrobiota bacterium]